MKLKEILTASDAAKELNKSTKTLQRWRARGEGPSYSRIGQTIVYSTDDLDEFLGRHRVSVSG